MPDNYKQILRLFWPIFLANIGIFTMSLADSLMLAHSNAEHLGLQSIGDMPITIALMLVNGLVQGTLFTTAQYYGQKKFIEVGAVFRNSIKFALYLSLIAIPLFIFAGPLLKLLKYPAEESLAVANVMKILSISIPFSLLYFVCMFFLNGIKRPWIATRIIIISNLLNVFLNWLLIEGNLGFPALYSSGVAISTTVVRIFLGISLLLSILFLPEFRKFDIIYGKTTISEKSQKLLGLSATVNLLSFEIGIAFCLFYAGHIGLLSAAAFTLSYRIVALSHLIAVSFAIAASILISPQRHKILATRKLIHNTFTLNNVIIIPLSILGITAIAPISQILSNDINLQILMHKYLPFVFIVVILRCINSIQIIILRTLYDLMIPSIIYFVSFVLIQPFISLIIGNWKQGTGIIITLIISNFIVSFSLKFRLSSPKYTKKI